MNKFKKISVFLILLFVSMAVFAYQLSPLSVSYDSRGAGSAKVYTITNDSDSPIAIQMKPVKRMVDENGVEHTESANAYFSIQPQKMIIKPQSTQLVRVQYRGPQTVTKELNFRIQAEQIPYSLGASQADAGQTISFLFVYSTSAYVKPSKIVESVRGTVTSDGNTMEIVIENTGSVHQLLSELNIEVSDSKGTVYRVPAEYTSQFEGLNLLTNSKFKLELPVPEELKNATGGLTANVEYNYKYTD